MKTKLLSLFVTLFFAGAATAQYAYFPFDSNVMDQMENVQSMASPAGVSFVVDDARGDVVYLDGVDGYISLGANTYDQDEITLNIWLNWTTEVDFQWWTRVFDFGTHIDKDPPAERNVMFITTFTDWDGDGEGQMQWNIHPYFWAPGTDSVLLSQTSIIRNRWYMLTMVHHPDYAQLWLDGVLQSEIELPGLHPSDMSDFEDIFIGRANWNDPLFTGKLDDFTIWDKALTEEEILELYGDFASSVQIPVLESARIYARGDNVRVELPIETRASVEVYSITGALVYKQENIGSVTDIRNMHTGVYIVRVISGNEATTQKVMIQRR